MRVSPRPPSNEEPSPGVLKNSLFLALLTWDYPCRASNVVGLPTAWTVIVGFPTITAEFHFF